MQIERSVVIQAPRARVWRALTESKDFAQWFGVTLVGAFVPGAALELVTTQPDYAGIRFPIFIEAVEPETTLSWRWFPGADNPERTDREQTTLVTFTLEDVPGGTRVTITETGFDRVKLAQRAKAFEDNTGGWEIQLHNLVKHVQA